MKSLFKVLKDSQIPFVACRPDGQILACNAAFSTLTGYMMEELKCLNVKRDLTPKDLQEPDSRIFEEFFNTGIPTSFEKEYLRKDGSRVPVELLLQLAHDDAGNILFYYSFITDLTERKRVENEFRETQNFLNNLFNYANAPIIVWDPEFIITRFNHAFERLTGYYSYEMIGKELSVLFPDERRDECLHNIERTLSGEYWDSVEIPVRCKNGEVRIALWNSANIHKDDGTTIMATIAQGQDITERKLIEDALRESEANLAKAQEMAHIGGWNWDFLDDVITWTDEHYRIFGLSPGEIPVNLDIFLGFVHDEDKGMIVRSINGAINEKVPFKYDFRIIRKDGEERFVHSESEIECDDHGTIVRLFGTIQDITERKNYEIALRDSEEKFKMLIDELRVGILLVDGKGNIIVSNQAVRQFLDVFSAGVRIKNIFDPECNKWKIIREDGCLLSMGDNPVLMCFSTGNPVKNMVLGISLGDNSEVRWVLVSAEPYFTNDGRIRQMICTMTDITERKKTDEALKEAKMQAELYLDLIGHDINNLNQIGIGYLELANMSLDIRDDDRAMISKSLEVFKSSSNLISNVRKLQHAKTSNIKMEPQDIGKILCEVRQRYSNIPGKDIEINYINVNGCFVMANELLNDVFSNIVGNSIKHTDGRVVIDIDLSEVMNGGRKYYRVSIEDNGPGIPDGQKGLIFNRLYRGSTKAKGKGLGLFLVKTLVEKIGGLIWVEDKISGNHEEGSKFVVMLPAYALPSQ